MVTVTISLTRRAYERLKKQKLPGGSFSDVVLREIPVLCKTADEILDYFESCPVPKANSKMRAAMLEGRSRQSREKSNRRGARP
jgi:predicted CopG family antitoxin